MFITLTLVNNRILTWVSTYNSCISRTPIMNSHSLMGTISKFWLRTITLDITQMHDPNTRSKLGCEIKCNCSWKYLSIQTCLNSAMFMWYAAFVYCSSVYLCHRIPAACTQLQHLCHPIAQYHPLLSKCYHTLSPIFHQSTPPLCHLWVIVDQQGECHHLNKNLKKMILGKLICLMNCSTAYAAKHHLATSYCHPFPKNSILTSVACRTAHYHTANNKSCLWLMFVCTKLHMYHLHYVNYAMHKFEKNDINT